MNIGMQGSVWVPVFNSFGCISKSGIAGSYSSSMFNFLRTSQTVFHCCCTVLHLHQKHRRIPISPYLLQHLLFSTVKKYSHSSRCEVISHCMLLMTYDGKCLLMCFLAICISSSEKHLFKSFAHFKTGLFIFSCWVAGVFKKYVQGIKLLLDMTYKYFSHPEDCRLIFLNSVLWCIKVFNVNEVQLVYFSIWGLCFWCHIKEIFAKSRSQRVSWTMFSCKFCSFMS